MNNLHLQITPLQVNCRSKSPFQLTCLFKKVAISTGHILEKRQLKAQPSTFVGTNNFDNGPTFNLSKQFQVNNTKISMHFMRKKDKAFTCIGSAQIDVATLPSTSCSVLSYPLQNSIYPQSSLKLEVRRQEQQRAPSKPSRYRGEEMNLLRTEGQIKEELLIGRRKNPNVPSAYQISRKNYKQPETSCHQSKPTSISNDKKNRSKKSYHQLYNASHNNSKSNSRTKITRPTKDQQDTTPRRRTPEPISASRIGRNQRTKKPEPVKHYAIGRQRGKFSISNSRETVEQPSELSIQPYSQSKNDSFDDSIQRPSKDKYEGITCKLERIQEQLMKVEQNKGKTSLNSTKGPEMMEQCIEPNLHKSQDEFIYNNQGPAIKTTFENHPVVNYLPSFMTGESSVSSEQPEQNNHEKELIKKVDMSKKQLRDLQAQNQELMRQNQLVSSKFTEAETTIHKLMRQLSDLKKDNNKKNQQIELLKNKVEKSQEESQEQHRLLLKMTSLYEQKMEEVFALQQQQSQTQTISNIGLVKKIDSSALESSRVSKPSQVRELEQKCGLLENELRSKKNILAEIVNIIWRYGDHTLMESIEKYMQQ